MSKLTGFYVVFDKTKKEPLSSFLMTYIAPAGFEPAHSGTKNHCLTTWRRGNS